VVDAQHSHHRRLFVNLVDDAVGAAPRRVQTRELTPQRPTDTVRIVEQRPEHELDDRRRNLLWEPVEEPRCGSGDA
jgi:hypothetical protein